MDGGEIGPVRGPLRVALMALVAVALMLAACGDDRSSETSVQTGAQGAPTTSAPAADGVKAPGADMETGARPGRSGGAGGDPGASQSGPGAEPTPDTGPTDVDAEQSDDYSRCLRRNGFTPPAEAVSEAAKPKRDKRAGPAAGGALRGATGPGEVPVRIEQRNRAALAACGGKVPDAVRRRQRQADDAQAAQADQVNEIRDCYSDATKGGASASEAAARCEPESGR